MQFDTTNPVIQLCAQGMQLEGEGKPAEAAALFMQAWNEAITPTEKFTAAHYVARHQPTVSDKLHWDEVCLSAALTIEGEEIKATYPSLYLNIGKCFEDLGNIPEARKNYQLAQSFAGYLQNDGYGSMIKAGIEKGLQRTGGANTP